MVGDGPITTPVSELSAPELLSTPSPRGPIWGLWAWRRGGYYGAERGFRIKAEARAEKKRLKLAAQDAAAANLASPETTVRTKTGAKDWASQVGVDPWPKGEAPKPTKSAGVAKPYQIQVTEYPRRRRANGKRVVEYLSDFNDGTAPLIKKIVTGTLAREIADKRTVCDVPAAPVRIGSSETVRDDDSPA